MLFILSTRYTDLCFPPVQPIENIKKFLEFLKFLIFHLMKFEIFNTDDDTSGSLEKKFINRLIKPCFVSKFFFVEWIDKVSNIKYEISIFWQTILKTK